MLSFMSSSKDGEVDDGGADDDEEVEHLSFVPVDALSLLSPLLLLPSVLMLQSVWNFALFRQWGAGEG